MLEGIVRESITKKATRELRRDGYLIANIYGKGVENINAAFKENEFVKAVRNKETLIFPVKVGGQEFNVVIQEYQKDPVKSKFLHVDLRIALPGVLTKYLVPVKTVGTPKGLRNKGVLAQSKKRLCVKCAAEHLPNEYTLDVTDLDVGDTILVRDIKVDKNVQIMDEDRISVVGVIKAK
ncbi:MAG: 50S ribosomal protein L25/general stress protein Ctc [Sulfurospirillaceae bacterium]|nr:50S ribosomal protein L25/general stress protein Ctc [Sulfurospirillaceae bacterium]